MVNAISRQILELWNRYKPTIAVNAIEYDRKLKKLLSTNLASLGTDCISRQQAIDALGELATFTEDWSCHTWMYTDDVYNAIKQLPTIQPEIVRCEECLYRKICSWEKQGAKFCSFAEKREGTT